jgi:hypothetical protein
MVNSYNFNVQHEAAGIVFQAAYVGSEGHHLRIIGDWNQGINGVRPISGFSSITIQQSVSNSTYHGLWLSANRRLTHNLTFNTSYTLSKSIDNNSVGSSNPQAQDFRNLRAERALSDFDARNRFVLSAIYPLPFHGQGAFLSRLAQGWSASPIVNLQSGNPFSPIIQVTDSRGSLEAFGPRFGLSYRVSDTWVVRSGYGMVFFEQSGITTPFTIPQFPFVQTLGQQSQDNVNAAFTLANGPTVQVAPPNPNSGLAEIRSTAALCETRRGRRTGPFRVDSSSPTLAEV